LQLGKVCCSRHPGFSLSPPAIPPVAGDGPPDIAVFRECGAAPGGESSDSLLSSADLLGSDGPASREVLIDSRIDSGEDGPSLVDPGPTDPSDETDVFFVGSCPLVVPYATLIPPCLVPFKASPYGTGGTLDGLDLPLVDLLYVWQHWCRHEKDSTGAREGLASVDDASETGEDKSIGFHASRKAVRTLTGSSKCSVCATALSVSMTDGVPCWSVEPFQDVCNLSCVHATSRVEGRDGVTITGPDLVALGTGEDHDGLTATSFETGEDHFLCHLSRDRLLLLWHQPMYAMYSSPTYGTFQTAQDVVLSCWIYQGLLHSDALIQPNDEERIVPLWCPKIQAHQVLRDDPALCLCDPVPDTCGCSTLVPALFPNGQPMADLPLLTLRSVSTALGDIPSCSADPLCPSCSHAPSNLDLFVSDQDSDTAATGEDVNLADGPANGAGEDRLNEDAPAAGGNLKKLANWPDWHAAFLKQLDAHHDAGTFVAPILHFTALAQFHALDIPSNILHFQWSSLVKADGMHKARACACGSQHSAPWLLQREPTMLHEENQAVINIVNHSRPTSRTRPDAIQEWCDRKEIKIGYILMEAHIADELTNGLSWTLHSCHACQAAYVGDSSPTLSLSSDSAVRSWGGCWTESEPGVRLSTGL